MAGDIAGDVEAEGEGEAAGSEPPPQAPNVVAIPNAKTAAKILVFMILDSSLHQT
jgi:hypothetical protein